MSMTVEGKTLYAHFANIMATQGVDIDKWEDLDAEDRGAWLAISEMMVWRQSTSGNVAEWERTVRMLDELRANEGSAVEIGCTNPEGTGPNNEAVDVLDDWTDWEPRRFYGPTLHAALAAALVAKAQAPEHTTPRVPEYELAVLADHVKRIVDRSPAPPDACINVLGYAVALWHGIRGLWKEGG
jgi:hypothetical protein